MRMHGFLCVLALLNVQCFTSGNAVEQKMLTVRSGADTVMLQPWGNNSLRVTIALGSAVFHKTPGALIPPGSDNKLKQGQQPPVYSSATYTANSVANGNIVGTVGDDGMVTITRAADGATILEETSRSTRNGTKSVNQMALNNTDSNCSGGPCCLDLSNWKKDDHAAVAISNCHALSNGLNQQWNVQPNGQIQVALDGKCLATNGNNVEVNACDAQDTKQIWKAPSLGGSPGTLSALGKCIQATKEFDGGVLQMVTCDSTNEAQLFTYSVVSSYDAPLVMSFTSLPTERIYGFGEHQQGHLDMKGTSFDMLECLEYGHSHGGEVCLPFVLGTGPDDKKLSYGMLWNMPNYGSVSFDTNATTWTAQAATQVDYFVTVPSADTPAESRGNVIMNQYVDAVGHVPVLPEYAAGYWHSKNRYASQADLLAAAEGFYNRSVNVSIIVIDYHHWVHMGDWSFDPAAWPDVPAMMEQLEKWGMKVMVSVWPFTAVNSSSFDYIGDYDLAVTTNTGADPVFWNDNNCNAPCYLYDPTQEDSREYMWSRVKKGYYDYGIKVYWLDAAEPEISTKDATKAASSSLYSLGSAQSVGMMFPYYHTRTFHDGLRSEGEQDVIMLTRSAWAGMQRWGAALWSGDTQSTFQSLNVSIAAGLNTQMSGIAWWTTDIGGYSGGNPSDPEFRELIVRWFQFGVTCPLFRQHGQRDTEIWGYGPDSYNAIVKIIAFRYSIHDYIMEQMEAASEHGTPVNRPLFWDFPNDPVTWTLTPTSYMFGPDYLVAPVLQYQQTKQSVYLPAGATWTNYFTNEQFAGGQTVTVQTPLEEFPLFKRS